MGKNFGKMPNMNEINKFVKSGAFNKQMQQHMPQIMEKVKKRKSRPRRNRRRFFMEKQPAKI